MAGHPERGVWGSHLCSPWPWHPCLPGWPFRWEKVQALASPGVGAAPARPLASCVTLGRTLVLETSDLTGKLGTVMPNARPEGPLVLLAAWLRPQLRHSLATWPFLPQFP